MPKTEQWEYNELLNPSLTDLNHFGSEGWEVYQVEAIRYPGTGMKDDHFYYLKRKKGGGL